LADKIEKELNQALPNGDFVAHSGRLRYIVLGRGSILKRAIEKKFVKQSKGKFSMKLSGSGQKEKLQNLGSSVQSEVFISYAFADQELGMRIHQALESAGQSVWIDQDDIRYADNWKDAVLPAMEQATAILFITSKASLSSKNCLEELEYAQGMGKRIIPIIAERVEEVPEILRERVRRDFCDPENFHSELLKLLQDITSDPEYVQLHTNLAFRAARWRDNKTGLLDSGEIKKAVEWVKWAEAHPGFEPRPTEFITGFIKTSKTKLRNRRALLIGVFFAIIAVIGVYFGIQWLNTIPRSGISVQIQGDEGTEQRTIDGVTHLREHLDATIPEKSDRTRLLIATWNIQNLGDKRPDEALHYIAEIISHFDIVAIQELKGESEDYQRILEILGPKWMSVESDINEGRSGNLERLAFIYDSRKLSPSGLIGELVIIDDDKGISQPARSPYFVGFSLEGIDIVFCNVHIIWGQDIENRVIEIEAIADQLADKAKRGREFPPSIVLLGDVQGGSAGGQILEAIEDAGFILPSALSELPTSTLSSRGRPYDQIALMLSSNLTIDLEALGVIDFNQLVYTDDQEEIYKAEIGDFNGSSFSRQRSFWMSDHLPKWLTLQISQETE
jgi:hypothetical protein